MSRGTWYVVCTWPRTILEQYWSVFILHWRQSRQARTKHPMPARSPTLNPVTPEPTSVTMPTISCLRGATAPFHQTGHWLHVDDVLPPSDCQQSQAPQPLRLKCRLLYCNVLHVVQ